MSIAALRGSIFQPLYTANDWPSDRNSSGFPGFLPLTRGSQALGHTTAGWEIRQEHLHPSLADANRPILADLEYGVTSIQLGVVSPNRRFSVNGITAVWAYNPRWRAWSRVAAMAAMSAGWES